MVMGQRFFAKTTLRDQQTVIKITVSFESLFKVS